MSGDVDTKKKKTASVKMESMKKKDRKKLRKMKSDKFEMTTKAKALWEECRRSVICCLFCKLVKFTLLLLL